MDTQTKEFIKSKLEKIMNTPNSELSFQERHLKEFYIEYSEMISNHYNTNELSIIRKFDSNGRAFAYEGYILEGKK